MHEDENRAPIGLFGAILGAFLLIYLLSGLNPFTNNNYNSYSLQAQSWLQGRLDLPENYAHLEIAVYQGRYYISFPPFPSLVMLPFIPLFGVNTPDHFIALCVALLSTLYAYRIAFHCMKDRRRALFFSLFLVVGSNYLHVSVWGAVWYIAQNMAFLLTLMSFYYAFVPGTKRGWLSVFCLACAVGCRPFQLVYAPLTGYLLWQGREQGERFGLFVRKRLAWLWPAIGMGLFYMALNYARFGNVFEFGHNYLPEFVEAPDGQFSIAYMLENLKHIWIDLPTISASGTLVFSMFNAVAFWIVSPIAVSFVICGLFCLLGRKTRGHGYALWLIVLATVLIHLLLLSMHRTMGGHHFGNRYTVDCLPALFVGLCFFLPRRRGRLWPHAALALWGLGVNIWGSAQYFGIYR